MENKVKTSKKERIPLTLIASIIAPFIIFVAIPMIVFGNNISEFLFNWNDFVPLCLVFAILFSAIIFFAIFFLPERAYKICLHILIAGDFLIFLQSTYLNGNLSLSGDNLGGGYSTLSKIINLAIWIIVVAGAVVLAILKDKKKYIKTGALILCVVVASAQLISTVVPVISNKNFFKSRENRIESSSASTINYSTYKDLNKYSTTGNIYYFVIDMFDEKYAETALENQPDIFNNLTGFTWYQDNVTLYGHTYPAVAYALTGTEHSSELYNAEYMKKAYEENNYLMELKKAGYKINLYADMGNGYGYAGLPEYVNNALPCTKLLQSRFSLFKKMVKLGLYVSFPKIAKSLLGNVTSSEFESLFKFTALDGTDGFHSYNDVIKNHVDNLEFEAITDKQFTYFHMAGTHNVYTEDQTKDSSATGLTKFSIDVINVFLQNLKDKGLYDEATIVITGDHSAVYGHPAPVALFFKPAQSEAESKEDLKISTAKVEQKNIMPSIFDSIGITSEIATQKGDTPLHLTDSAERRFVYHTFDVDFAECVYKVTGSLKAGGSPSSNWTLISEQTYKGRRVYD